MKPLLSLEKLTKQFGGLTAAYEVTLELQDSEILGLIGPNGAGKTTLFNMISGAYLPTSGRIRFEGADITDWPSHKVAKLGVARTFQLVKPFARLSVVDNVMVGAFLRVKGAAKAAEKAREVVDFVGLESYADRPAQVLTTAGRKRLELAVPWQRRPNSFCLMRSWPA